MKEEEGLGLLNALGEKLILYEYSGRINLLYGMGEQYTGKASVLIARIRASH
jgi:hypothetical protein